MSKKFRKVFKQLKTPLSWALTLILVSQMFPAQGMAYAIEEATQALVPEVEEAVVYEDELLNEDVAIVEEAPVEETAVAEDEAAVVEEEAIAPEAEDAVEPATEPEAEAEPAVDPEPADEAEPATDVEPAVEPEAEAETEPEAEPEPAAEIAYPAQRLTATAGNMSVVVTAPEGALPEGSQLTASLIDTAYVADAVEAAVDAKGKTTEDMVAIDVTILDADGNEIQPLLPVSVKFANAGISGSDIAVYHIDSETGAANEVDTATANSRVQSFEADGFSVYVVVEQGEDARLKVTFVKGDGTTETMMINQRQADTHIEQYIFDPGEGKIPEGSLFKGWTTEENYTASTEAKTIADVRNEVKAKVDAGVTDGTEVTYYAMVFDPYTVTYLDERGIMVKIDQTLVRHDVTPGTYEVSQNYTPYPAETEGVVAEFMGWQQLVPEVPGERVLYQPGDTFEFGSTKAYTLKAFTQEGHWLSFDENLSNATYTEPQFVAIGQNPTTPAAPTRTGYTFDAWYTEDASSERDGQAAGSAFNFDAALTANTTVYAKWNKATTASYNVVVWLQNKEATGYDYSGTTVTVNNATVGNNTYQITARGTGNTRYARVYTGSSTSSYTDLDDFTGFHLSTVKPNSDGFDAPTAVAAEGNTVINVYYDRNTITYNFRHNSGTTDTFSGLYGSDFNEWPDPATGRCWYNSDARAYFPLALTEFNQNAVVSGSNKTEFTFTEERQDSDYTLVVYKQTESGAWDYSTAYTITRGSWSGGTWTPSETYIGYTLDAYRKETSGSWTSCTPTTSIRNAGNLYLRYTRNQYDIVYNDGVFVDGSGNPVPAVKRTAFQRDNDIYYEADISSKNIKPEYDGFVFLGWYDNELCAGDPYAFDKMPAHNVTLYAKWGQSEYEVNLHANDSEDDPIKYTAGDSQATIFWAAEGEKVGNVGGERIYYDLVGWYSDEAMKHPFDFDSFVLNETMVGKYGKLYTESEIDPEYPTTIGEMNLYAKWRSKLIGSDGIVVEYDATDSGTGAPKDNHKYVDLAESIAQGAATPNDSENYVFSHWAVQKWNGSAYEDSGVNVYPGDTFEVLAANAKITDADGNPVAVSELKDGETYTYTVQLKAVYIEKDKEVKTSINWYNNYDGGKVATSENIKINEATPIPAAPTRTGYEFLGWIRDIEEGPHTGVDGELWLEYKDGGYLYNGKTATQVAADENLVGDGTQHHALYAKWEAQDVKYTVEFYYMNDDGTYPETPKSTDETRTAKTDTKVSVNDADKTPSEMPKYALDDSKADAWTGTVAGDGSLVLKVYFKLNQSEVTVHHYLKGTTTKVADDVTELATIGTDYTAKAATTFYDTYAGKTLTPDPIQPITVKVDGNEVTVYYTLPLTIKAKTASKPYDGTPLAGEYTIDGALDTDTATIETALGEAPSITEVGEKEYLTAEDQAKITGIPAYYVVSYTEGTLTITKNATAITITSADDSKMYDGTELHKAEYTVMYGETKIEAAADGSFTLPTGDKITITDTSKVKNVADTKANNNTFTYELANADQYSNVSTTFDTLTITKRAVTLTSATDSKPYDGTALTNDEVKVSGDGFVDGEGATYNVTGTQTKVGDSKNTFTYTLNDGTDEGNYTITPVEGTLTVSKSEKAVTISSESETWKYDGEEHSKPVYTVKYGDETATADETGLVFTLSTGDTVTISEPATVKNVSDTAAENNTYKYVLTNADQYETVTATYGTLTVTPRAITMTSADGNKQYDGTPLVKNAQTDVTVSGDGFVDGEGATYTITGTQTEVGDSKNAFTYTLNEGTLAENYTITPVEGTLKVTKNAAELTIASGNNSWKYDGEDHSEPTYTITFGEETGTATKAADGTYTYKLSTGDTITISKTATVKNVSDTAAENNTFEYVLTNADQYENVTATFGKLEITPRTVTLTSASDEKVYDGTPLVKNAQTDVTVGGDKFVEGEGATYTITGTQTEVGESKNAFTYKLNDGTLEGNYTITTTEGTLKVTELTDKVTVTITEHKGEYTYDGTEKTVTGYDVDIDNDLYTEKDFTFSGNATVKGTDAGSYPMELKAADFTNTNKNFSNVEFVIVDGTLEITPRTVTLTSESDSKVYDGTALTKPEVTVGGDGFVAGEVTDIKATGTITEVGTETNTITYTEGAKFNADNYDITKDEGTLEITAVTDKVTVTITEHKGEYTYDGTEKTVTGYDVSIDNKLYTEDDFTFSGNATVKGTDAGSYPMELKPADFKNTNENFSNVEFVIVDGTLEIAKRKVTLTSATDEKEYDGNPLTNDKVTAEGFVDGEGATYDVTGAQTLVGSSENTFTYTLNEGTKAANYDITTIPGTLTVTNRDAKYEITVEANSTEATYDGKEHAATGVKTLEFEVEGNKYTVSGLTTSDPKSTDACEMPNNITGTAVVKDAAGNDVTEQFAVKTVNGKLKINPLEVVIKSGDAEKQYDGKALTSDEITYPKPFVEGEGVIITMTGTQTLVGESKNTFTYELRDNTKAANYTITTEFGTLKVTDRTNPFEVTVVSNSDEVTYDGNEHKVEGFETLEFTIDGVKFTVSGLTAEGKGTDAGEYPDTISGTAVVKDADGNDVTAQFKVNQTEGKLVIKPVTDKVTVTITEHSGEFVFDNTEKTVEGYDVTNISNSLYKDTDFAFSGDATVKGTNAGTYDMELKPADFSNTSKNFTDVEFVIVDGQLVITPKHIDDPDDPGNPSKDLTVTGPEDTVYNGLEQKQPVQVTDKETGQVLVEGTDFELTYGDDITNVGTVPVTVKGIGNYEGTFNLSYKITPAPLKITTGSAEKVYDATPLTSDECEVEGLVNGETLRVDPDGSQTLVGSSDNTVTITWADDVIDHYPQLGARILSTVENPTAKKSNYEVEVTLGTLTVTDDGVPTDLVVTKTHEGEEFGLGETITFTLKATNIYDEERDITFVEIEGVEVAQATFEKVPAGETVETTATYTVTEADILAGEFKNEVTVKIGDAEHGPAEDIVVIEEKNPHLTVTKTVTSAAETYAVGETIEYKIVVENDGNLTISDIKVTDELTKDEWTIEQLAPGEKQEFTAKYTVTEADATAGKVVNTATATGKDPEGNDPSVTPGTTETPVKKPELPKTGDTSGLVSAAASASMGLMSLAGWLHTLRRRKEDDEQ